MIAYDLREEAVLPTVQKNLQTIRPLSQSLQALHAVKTEEAILHQKEQSAMNAVQNLQSRIVAVRLRVEESARKIVLVAEDD